MTYPDLPDEGPDRDRLIEAYFVDHRILAAETSRLRANRLSSSNDPLSKYDGELFDWLVMMLTHRLEDGPERAWPVILDLIARAPDEGSLDFIGASAVEDLVDKAGVRFLDRIVGEASSNPRFRRAMAAVWYRETAPFALKQLIDAARASPDG